MNCDPDHNLIYAWCCCRCWFEGDAHGNEVCATGTCWKTGGTGHSVTWIGFGFAAETPRLRSRSNCVTKSSTYSHSILHHFQSISINGLRWGSDVLSIYVFDRLKFHLTYETPKNYANFLLFWPPPSPALHADSMVKMWKNDPSSPIHISGCNQLIKNWC